MDRLVLRPDTMQKPAHDVQLIEEEGASQAVLVQLLTAGVVVGLRETIQDLRFEIEEMDQVCGGLAHMSLAESLDR